MCVYVRIGQKREGEGGGGRGREEGGRREGGMDGETLFLDLGDQLISSVI